MNHSGLAQSARPEDCSLLLGRVAKELQPQVGHAALAGQHHVHRDHHLGQPARRRRRVAGECPLRQVRHCSDLDPNRDLGPYHVHHHGADDQAFLPRVAFRAYKYAPDGPIHLPKGEPPPLNLANHHCRYSRPDHHRVHRDGHHHHGHHHGHWGGGHRFYVGGYGGGYGGCYVKRLVDTPYGLRYRVVNVCF